MSPSRKSSAGPRMSAKPQNRGRSSRRRNLPPRKLEQECSRLVLGSLRSHVAVIDREGTIVAVNPSWKQFARGNGGNPARCNVGANYLQVCEQAVGPFSEEAPNVAAGLRRILKGSASGYSIEYPCPSPTEERWFILEATPLRHRRLGAVLLHVDITDRVKAERQVREKESRMRAVLESAVDAVITLDKEFTIQSVNPATERMFGYAARELVGQKFKLLVPPPYFDECFRHLSGYLQTVGDQFIGMSREINASHRDGRLFPASLALSLIQHLKLFTAIIRDLTYRKQLEREVLEIASLEQRRLGQDLHDTVGQELTALNLMVNHLAESIRSNARIAGLVGRILKGLQRSQDEVRALIRGLVPVDVDTEGLAAALAEMARRVKNEQKVNCTFQCAEPTPLLDNVAATHLYLIAQEAVHNSLKHARAQNLSISLKADQQCLVMKVADDGIGFAEGLKESRGMGLHIMRNRASLIGAAIAIEAAKPAGTAVTCVLPVRGRGRGEP